MVPLRNLYTFCTAAQHLSFKRTAELQSLSASAVSHQIRTLEDHLGVPLFERQTRQLVLTSAGARLQASLDGPFRAIDAAVKELRSQGRRQQVRVRMPDFFASELFIPQVSGFSRRNTDIDLRIESGPAAEAGEAAEAAEGAADVVILLAGRTPAAHAHYRLFPVRLVPACSPQWSRRLAQDPAGGLGDATLLVHKRRPRCWAQWSKSAGVPMPSGRQIIQFDSMASLVQATAGGVGVGLIPMPLSRAWIERGDIVRVHAHDLVTSDCYYATWSGATADDEAAARLLRWIRERFTDYA